MEQRSSGLKKAMDKKEVLMKIYQALYNHFGAQNWWPAETPFEVCVGAILTQGTTWKNVKKAIENLKKEKVLSPEIIYNMELPKLSQIIKPCGFYNVKAKRLKEFVVFLIKNYDGDLSKMFEEETFTLREKLLKIKGLGKETVDSILLYAGDKPVFVVDAYTYRIFNRHLFIPEEISYDELQNFFMENLPEDVALYKEYHALIVACGKNFCKKKNPECKKCPLNFLWE